MADPYDDPTFCEPPPFRGRGGNISTAEAPKKKPRIKDLTKKADIQTADVGAGRTMIEYKRGSEFDLYGSIAEAFNPTPARIYQMGRALVHIVDDPVLGTLTAAPMAKPELYMALNKQILIMQGDGEAKIPNEVLDYMMFRPDMAPDLRGIVASPIIRADGEVLMAEGEGTRLERYDPETKMFGYHPPSWPVVTYEPEDAVKILRKLWSDTAFAAPEDFGTGLCLLLTMMARHVLTDCPAFLLTAASEGTGKTTFAQMCGAIAYGIRAVPGRRLSMEEEEVGKTLLSMGRTGDPLAFFDNLPTGSKIESPSLEMAITSHSITSRVLGESREINVPFHKLIVMTVNNPAASPDMARRLVVCRFDSNGVLPSAKKWAEQDILGYCMEHRQEFWNCAASILCHHMRQEHREEVKRRAAKLAPHEMRAARNKARDERRYWKADFPSWSRIVLGAVERVVKFNPLASTIAFSVECNPDLADAGAVFLALKGQGSMTAGDIVSRAKDYRPLGDALAAWGKGGMPPDVRVVGRKLAGYVDRHIAGLRLEARTEHNQKRFWVIET